MSIQAIAPAIKVINTLAAEISGAKANTGPVMAGGFASELEQSIRSVNRAQIAGDNKARAFQSGDPSVSLNDVMVDMQKASIGFEMATQVRNKLVTAYKDIMSMQV